MDDGSCAPHQPGCTDPTAPNYKPEYTMDDGSCSFVRCRPSTHQPPSLFLVLVSWFLSACRGICKPHVCSRAFVGSVCVFVGCVPLCARCNPPARLDRNRNPPMQRRRLSP